MNNFKKINLYNRHYTRNKKNSTRPDWFNFEKCFGNLLLTTNFNLCNLTIVLEKEEDYDTYFVKKFEGIRPFKVKFIDTSEEKWKDKEISEKAGWCRAIAACAEVIKNDNLPEDELVGICDEDYLHLPRWCDVTLDYYNKYLNDNSSICLFDNFDKYLFTSEKEIYDEWGTGWHMYRDLVSKIRTSSFCHWRTVPNFMTSSIWPVKLFNRDYEKHWRIGQSDSQMCDEIAKEHKTTFWTPIPSFNCHVQYPFLGPFIDWQDIMEKIRVKPNV